MNSVLEPQILFENDEVIALNKPAGVSVHSNGRTEHPLLTDWLQKNKPEVTTVGGTFTVGQGEETQEIPRMGIVHRLDQDTTGVLLVAKTEEAFLSLRRQFEEHTIEKEYRALVYGVPDRERGEIERPIARAKNDFRKWVVATKGRPASTIYKVLETFGKADFLDSTAAYLAVFPKTGRTHQVRVHLGSLGHPVLCDGLYAPARTCPVELGRQALHAFRITFSLPETGSQTVEAPLALDLLGMLERLRGL